MKYDERSDQKSTFLTTNTDLMHGASVKIKDNNLNFTMTSNNDLLNDSYSNQFQKNFNNNQPKSSSMQLAGNGVGVTIMMKPFKSQQGSTITSTATVLTSNHSPYPSQNQKKSNDKLFNIGFESLKLSNPVPFSALKNVKDVMDVKDVKDQSNPSSLNGTHNHQISTNNSSSISGKLPSNALIAQRSISFKNSSLESLSNNNIVCSNNQNTSVGKNVNNLVEKDRCYQSNNRIIANELNNSSNIGHGIVENVNNNNNNCVYRVNRASINENSALCQSTRSNSSSTNRKEKKTSVGYRLGKRKLLFEKRKYFKV